MSAEQIQKRMGRIKAILRKDHVLIYSMGKVGSTSVEKYLPDAYHTHTLYGFPPSPPYHYFKYGRIGSLLRRLFVYPAKRLLFRAQKRINIITFYRDPIDRNPSMFMQDLSYWISAYLLWENISGRREEETLLVDAYKSIFPHDYPIRWVREELSRFTGIPSDELMLGEADYRIVRRGKCNVFIGRIERIDEYFSAIQDFTGCKNFDKIGIVNRGAGKWYAPIYSKFTSDLAHDTSVSFCDEFRRLNGYSSMRSK